MTKIPVICLLVGLTVVGTAVPAAAAIDKKTRQQYEMIVTDPEVIYGEGYGKTNSAAEEAALFNLTRQITVTVQGSTDQQSTEKVEDGSVTESSDSFRQMVKSYSGATLTNARYMMLEDTPEFHVMYYMKRSDVEAIFERRKERIDDYVRSALRAEKSGKVDEALQCLNNAYMLINSLQHPEEMWQYFDGEKQVLIHYIPRLMKEICGNVKFRVADVKEDCVDLAVTYKNQPVTTLGYKYFDGRRWSDRYYSVRDGKSEIEIDPSAVDKFEVAIEYEYRDECKSDRELAPLFESFDGLSVADSRKTLAMGNKLKSDKKARKEFAQYVAAAASDGVAQIADKEVSDHSEAVNSIINAIRSRSYAAVRDRFSDSGWEMFNGLLGYGNAKIVGTPKFTFHRMGDRVVCRSIPMSFTFPQSKRQLMEDVTFTFGEDGKVESLAFSLGSEARDGIFAKGGEAWTDQTKMTIVTFLENYKTAFALKRLDYIESIFDDNAMIITGHVVKKMERTGSKESGFGFAQKDQVTYARKSKREYLDYLRRSFNSKEFINVRFADNDVMKAGYGGETFGIQIRQQYTSSNYADEGYLFLLVDLNEEDKPVIHVRTWQPERNGDLTPGLSKNSRDYGVFSTASFSL